MRGVLAILCLLIQLLPLNAAAQSLCYPAPGGVVAWWRGQDNALDSEGMHPGTLLNGATFGSGTVGRAFDLDGTNDYVSVPDSVAFTPTSMTIQAWVVGDTLVGSDTIVAKANTGVANQSSWALTANGRKLRFVVYQGATARGIETANDVLYPGSSSHVAATFDAASQGMYIYVGGFEQYAPLISGMTATVTQPTDSATAVTIGAALSSGSPTAFFDGRVDELQIISRALSQDEIRAMVDAGSDGQCAQLGTCFLPADELVAFWPGDGNALDAALAHDGTLLNGATFTTGLVGQAFSLDGTNDYVEVPDAADLTPATQLTLHAWVYPNSTSGTTNLVSKHDASVTNGRSWLLQQVGGGLRLAVAQGTTERAVQTTAAVLATATWQHVAATVDLSVSPPDLAIYVNGARISTGAPSGGTPAAIQDSATPVRLGATRVSGGAISGFWNGRIDEAQVVARALSPAEVQKVYDAGAVGQCADTDNDGIADSEDDCPAVANAGQEDLDSDGVGDACDPDTDGDGVPNAIDNCPLLWNADKLDPSQGGAGDACNDADADGLSDEDELRYFGSSPDDPSSHTPSVNGWCATELPCPDLNKSQCSGFGSTVALSGDWLLVGDPNFDDDSGNSDVGRAFIYGRTDTHWSLASTLSLSLSSDQRGGSAVALSSDTAVVGSVGTYYATATVFQRSGATWSQSSTLYPGWDVGAIDVDGDRMVVGMPTSSELDTEAGAARVYRHVTTPQPAWVLDSALVPSTYAPSDALGTSVALVGDRVVVGAPGWDGVDQDVGRAYVFRKRRGVWHQETDLRSSDPRPGNSFGNALSGERTELLVGARFYDFLELLTDSGGLDDTTRSGVIWSATKPTALPATVGAASQFGTAVSLGQRTAVIGGAGFGDAHVARKLLVNPDPSTSGWVAARVQSSLNGTAGFARSVAADGQTIVVGGGTRPVGGQTSGVVLILEARLQTDADCDGVLLPADNCPDVANPDQANLDGDALGDACDPDDDNDGVPDLLDSCPVLPNGGVAQQDSDGDLLGDLCDPCPYSALNDVDHDGVCTNVDNCPIAANADQADTDHDSIGDACDYDQDNDGVAYFVDNCQVTPNANQADSDYDGIGDVCDLDSDLAAVTQPGQQSVATNPPEYRWRFDPSSGSGFSSSSLAPSTTATGQCVELAITNTSIELDFVNYAPSGFSCCAWEMRCPNNPPCLCNSDHCREINGEAFGSAWFAYPDTSTEVAAYSDPDTLPDQCDNCKYTDNEDQVDSNGNHRGNACECGDLDDDGFVRIGPAPQPANDLLAVRYALANLTTLSTGRARKCNVVGPTSAADADHNGLRDDCNILDVAHMRRAAAGLLTLDPTRCPAYTGAN